MSLDRYAGGGRVLVVSAPRSRSSIVVGYLVPAAHLMGLACALAVIVAGVVTGHAVVGVFGGLGLGVLLWVLLLIVALIAGGRAAWRTPGGAAGLPLAELAPDGVRVRYRNPTPRERRRSVPAAPAFDVAAGWDLVTGWRDGTDADGQPVLVLDVSDAEAVTLAGGWSMLREHLRKLRAATGSPLAIHASAAGPEQVTAVREYLAWRGVPQRAEPGQADR